MAKARLASIQSQQLALWAHCVIFCPKWKQDGAKALNVQLPEQLVCETAEHLLVSHKFSYS